MAARSFVGFVMASILSVFEVTSASMILMYIEGFSALIAVGIIAPISYPFFLLQLAVFSYIKIKRKNENDFNLS
jgi:hypothetical protein